jgi:hypothetical protein
MKSEQMPAIQKVHFNPEFIYSNHVLVSVKLRKRQNHRIQPNYNFFLKKVQAIVPNEMTSNQEYLLQPT